jgi:hypothetical protein
MHDPKSGNCQPSNTKHGLFYYLMGKTYNHIDTHGYIKIKYVFDIPYPKGKFFYSLLIS